MGLEDHGKNHIFVTKREMRFAPQDGSLRGMLLVIMTFDRILHEVLDFEKSHTSGPFHQVGKKSLRSVLKTGPVPAFSPP